MIAVDTNVLARFYVDDPSDPEAAAQRPLAAALMQGSRELSVSVTVILEFAWVLRAFYEFDATALRHVIEHLVGLAHVAVEDWAAVLSAAQHAENGLDFADALHLARSANASEFATFDDKGFARKALKMKLLPPVVALK